MDEQAKPSPDFAPGKDTEESQKQNSPPELVTGNTSPSYPEDIHAPKTVTDNMETHAHHIHKSPGKKLWHYFFEFFMLFLAITAGFFVENIREHYIENKRAREYALTMTNDLSSDTTELKSYLKYMAYAAKNVDTLLQMMTTADPKDIPSGRLYWYGLWGGAPRTFISNDGTLQQMKGSGSLRYFTNPSINEKIAHYDLLCRKMKSFDEFDQQIYTEVRKLRAQIFEFRYNAAANDIVQANMLSFDRRRIDSFIQTHPPLLTYDKTIFNQYIELVRSRFLERKVRYGDSLLLEANGLIINLRKEYQLE